MAATTVNSTTTTTSPSASATPNLFARFERSLSQLNLGGKRKSTSITPQDYPGKTGNSPTTPITSSSSSSTPTPSPSHQKSHARNLSASATVTDGSPPPLPQRNIPRKSLPTSPISNSQVSDLDASMMTAIGGLPTNSNNLGGAKRKNKNNRIKANSDPKMSSDLMLQMESSQYPPPLPPRTNFHEDGVFGQFVTNKDSNDTHGDGRSLPNSLATQMNYPVISTSVTVRDGVPPPNYNFHAHHAHQNSSDSNCNVTDGVTRSKVRVQMLIFFFCATLNQFFFLEKQERFKEQHRTITAWNTSTSLSRCKQHISDKHRAVSHHVV